MNTVFSLAMATFDFYTNFLFQWEVSVGHIAHWSVKKWEAICLTIWNGYVFSLTFRMYFYCSLFCCKFVDWLSYVYASGTCTSIRTKVYAMTVGKAKRKKRCRSSQTLFSIPLKYAGSLAWTILNTAQYLMSLVKDNLVLNLLV